MRHAVITQIAESNGRLAAIVPLDQKEVGRRLKAARRAKHWTQLDFALKMGRSPASVSRWERGYLPPVRELMRIAEMLEVDPAALVEEQRPDQAILASLAELAKLRDPIEQLLAELRERPAAPVPRKPRKR